MTHAISASKVTLTIVRNLFLQSLSPESEKQTIKFGTLRVFGSNATAAAAAAAAAHSSG
jgi:hypothetical protein